MISNSDWEIRDMLIKFLCEVTGKKVTNLKEDLVDGEILATMVENMIKLSGRAEECVPQLVNETDELMRVCLTLDAADQHLRIPALIEAEDLVSGQVDEKSIMLFLSLFKNLYDNKRQLESLSVCIDEELANIDAAKNAFDYGSGFASVDLNSDVIGVDHEFLKLNIEEEKVEIPEPQEKVRTNIEIQREEDEDAKMLELLVSEQREMAERQRLLEEEEERKRLEEELRKRLEWEREEEERLELERIERERQELALKLAEAEREALLMDELNQDKEAMEREERRRMEEERLAMEEELRRLEEEAAAEERERQRELEETLRLEESLRREQEEAERIREEERLRLEEEERLRREMEEIELMEKERLEEERRLREEEELERLEEERLRMEREFAEELARSMEEAKRAEEEQQAPPLPPQNAPPALPNRDARRTMTPRNTPTGGDWCGNVYVVSQDPNLTYVPVGVKSYKEQVSPPPPKTGLAGFLGSTKDFGTRIGKEIGHMFEDDNNHATYERFSQFFKFIHPEPLFMEFACKFASGEGQMVIGFGFVTRNFLCLNGGNARDQLSVIIPLVDVEKIEVGVAALFSQYSLTPKILLASETTGTPNALVVFDVFNQVHRIYSVYNVERVNNILTAKWKDALRNGALDNSIHLREGQKQVEGSHYQSQRVVATNVRENVTTSQSALPPLPPRSGSVSSLPPRTASPVATNPNPYANPFATNSGSSAPPPLPPHTSPFATNSNPVSPTSSYGLSPPSSDYGSVSSDYAVTPDLPSPAYFGSGSGHASGHEASFDSAPASPSPSFNVSPPLPSPEYPKPERPSRPSGSAPPRPGSSTPPSGAPSGLPPPTVRRPAGIEASLKGNRRTRQAMSINITQLQQEGYFDEDGQPLDVGDL
eukprot:TRINITY_DN6265_c0_g1_i1.p1 TRINITY_DN6265_c0_g1~~TRINITY_DN6265_c0_g1_i1.p1  ORF type:complete len:1044 (+),score=318.93 TRINITY_DN6265_c0_g1_i1:467-3133(+)